MNTAPRNILNLFHVTQAPNASHFTSLRLLKCVSTAGRGGEAGESFITLQRVIGEMTDAFGNEEDVKQCLMRMIAVDRQLLELDTRRPDSLDGATAVRVTASGSYYLTFLVNSFAYLDLVWHDTPFQERGQCDHLVRLINESEMPRRFERVEYFLDYLEREETQELRDRGLEESGAAFWGPFVPRIRRHFEGERDRIWEKRGRWHRRAPGTGRASGSAGRKK